jgi:hypothetical protein
MKRTDMKSLLEGQATSFSCIVQVPATATFTCPSKGHEKSIGRPSHILLLTVEVNLFTTHSHSIPPTEFGSFPA